jgi:hypothetical protein
MKFEISLWVSICVLVGFMVVCGIKITRHRERVVMPAAYKAWAKHTGNSNELTYEEWRDLIRVQPNIR